MTAAQASTTPLIAQLALPALWMTAIWAFAGSRNARRFVAPLGYLYVAIPVWHLSIEYLRSLTILVVSGWIRAAGLPAFIEGNLFHVPSGTFEVQEGCAGFHYALVALALAALVGVLHHRRAVPAALLVFFGLMLAVVGNWLRVFGTVVVGQSSDQNFLFLLIRDHHPFFGWALFILFMAPLFSSTGLWSPARRRYRRSARPQFAHAKSSGGAPAHMRPARFSPGQFGSIAGSIRAVRRSRYRGAGTGNSWLEPRRGLGGCAAAAVRGCQHGAAAWYADGAARVGAYVAHYADSTAGRTRSCSPRISRRDNRRSG